MPPAAMVVPESITYDETYGRGMDRMTLVLIVVVGKVVEQSSHERLDAYVDGTDTTPSIKDALEQWEYTSFDTLRVVSEDDDTYTVAGVDYLAGLFTLDIAGSGD